MGAAFGILLNRIGYGPWWALFMCVTILSGSLQFAAVGMIAGSMSLAGSFGDGTVGDIDLAATLQGAVIKEDDKDTLAWKEYLENVMKKRGEDWFGLYAACRELLS